MLLYGMQQMPMIDFCFMIPRSHSKYVTDFDPWLVQSHESLSAHSMVRSGVFI